MLVAMLLLLAVSTISGWMQVTVRFFGVWWVEDTHAFSSDAVMVLVELVHVGDAAVGGELAVTSVGHVAHPQIEIADIGSAFAVGG